MSQDMVSLKAPAKVNLYLEITGRREDGYHYLATLMQKISLYDQVDLKKEESGIRLYCPDSDLPEDETNLCFRAAQIFFEKMGGRLKGDCKGVSITLHKSVPEAAGLGGGSSDAAAVLKGLDNLFATSCAEEELLQMGAPIGADVSFFVTSLPAAWATGIGEQLQSAVPLSDYLILVVNPGFPVSTSWVYENFALTVGQNINNLKSFQNCDVGSDLQPLFLSRTIRPEELFNDLEQFTSSQYPKIDQLKKRMLNNGAVASMMSGSGPTVFGLFKMSDVERAEACAQELEKEYQSTFLVEALQA